MLNWVFPLSMFIFFILFNILTLHDSQKYDIDNKTTASPFPVFPGKHINRLARRPRLRTRQPARRHLALLCIEVLCIALLSLELQCITLQCITLLCITAQCIALQGIPDPHNKDPNFFANVRTRLPTDFIDFLGFRCVFFPGPFCALSELYEPVEEYL